MKSVCIIQPVLKNYRVPFFQGLAGKLAEQGIELTVVYGTPWRGEIERGDHATLPPPLGHPVRGTMLFGKLLLQPVLRPWLREDLVIVEQANKHVLNYLLLLLRALRLKRLAFWGHGRDRQADPSGWGERWKRATLGAVDWWFAYTGGAAEYLKGTGFPSECITVVDNAVDTVALRSQVEAVTESDRARLREELGFSERDRVALFCGSLYPNKRLDWLFAAADRVYERDDAFRLLILGGGPLADEVRAFAAGRPWVRYVGPRFGPEKARYLSIGEVWLNPGLVGLGILDAFAAGLPLLTTSVPYHSPEIDYLRHGENGLVLPTDADAYAEAVEGLLGDRQRLAALAAGARASAGKYTVEQMVRNFADGITKCLATS